MLSELQALPVELHGELKLPRIVSRRRLPCIGKQRADCGHVVPVRDVEHVGNQFHVKALAEVDALGDAQIVKHGPRRDTGVAAKIAVKLQQTLATTPAGHKTVDARLLKNPRGRILAVVNRAARRIHRGVRPPGKRRQLKIVVVAGDDVERPPRPEFYQRRERPIAEELAAEAVTAQLSRLVNAAEYKTVALIEQRGRTVDLPDSKLSCGVSVALQIGRVVDRMRPGVGSEKFVVLVEALAQVGAESVIDRTAVRVVGVHVAERNAAAI